MVDETASNRDELVLNVKELVRMGHYDYREITDAIQTNISAWVLIFAINISL